MIPGNWWVSANHCFICNKECGAPARSNYIYQFSVPSYEPDAEYLATLPAPA